MGRLDASSKATQNKRARFCKNKLKDDVCKDAFGRELGAFVFGAGSVGSQLDRVSCDTQVVAADPLQGTSGDHDRSGQSKSIGASSSTPRRPGASYTRSGVDTATRANSWLMQRLARQAR